MRVADAVTRILQKEGIGYLSCYPTTPLIESAAKLDIRPLVCRQERIGVGIADGFARVTNGRPPGVFAMQFGPGVENAFPGVATAFADSSPVLLLPLGHPRDRDGLFPLFSSVRGLQTVTKSAERIAAADRTVDTMRRAFAALRNGRPGPALVEIPVDLLEEEIDAALVESYVPPSASASQADPSAVDAAVRALLSATRPVILAGAGALQSQATRELAQLAELIQIPVISTLAGKSAISERNHPLSIGSASGEMSGTVYHFLTRADLVLAVGSSLIRHILVTPMPAGVPIIQITNEPADFYKFYPVAHPLLGDAKHVLQQIIDSCSDQLRGRSRDRGDVIAEIDSVRQTWLDSWLPKLTSREVPINPYRVVWEFTNVIDPAEAIVTHDSGNPRYQLMPFYRSDGPRTYLGWGKSHQLGTGLGLAIGAKLAAPDKFCAVFMGDSAFGMTGLDLETAVRNNLPVCAVVLKNSTMAVETEKMRLSHAKYGTRDVGGDYADIARALGCWAEKVEDPEDVGPAILRAKRATQEGQTTVLEFITSAEMAYSHLRPFG